MTHWLFIQIGVIMDTNQINVIWKPEDLSSAPQFNEPVKWLKDDMERNWIAKMTNLPALVRAQSRLCHFLCFLRADHYTKYSCDNICQIVPFCGVVLCCTQYGMANAGAGFSSDWLAFSTVRHSFLLPSCLRRHRRHNRGSSKEEEKQLSVQRKRSLLFNIRQ